MKRLYIDFKEDCHGNITGPMKYPADGAFVLEALVIAVQQLSNTTGVPPEEVLNDMRSLLYSNNL